MAEGMEKAGEVSDLADELSAAVGYMLNACIALDSGERKARVIATLEAGMKRARAALEASHG